MPECKICKYISNNSANFQRHCKSKTHTSLVERSETIQRKKKETLLKKEQKIFDEIKLNNEIINKKLDNIEKNRKHDKDLVTQKLNKIEKQQLAMSKDVKKITDYVDFLNKYCPNAEPLTLITDSEIDEILQINKYENFDFERMIINYAKVDKMHEKIGDLILKSYLKSKDPTRQRIWTSDISRLIYLIFQMVNKKGNWYRDKKGVMFTELVISPIIKRIQFLISKFAKHEISNFNNREIDARDNIKILANTQTAENIGSKVYAGKIIEKILKYIATKISVVVKREEIFEIANC